jgi:antitoxin HicB
MEYPALFEPAEEGGFVITFLDFDWGITQGDSEEQGREMALDALQLIIREQMKNGEPIPRPSRPKGRQFRMIRLPALQAAKIELYRQFLASGLRKAELARRLGMSKTIVDRLFDIEHQSRLDQIEAAFRVLGKEITIEVRDAA